MLLPLQYRYEHLFLNWMNGKPIVTFLFWNIDIAKSASFFALYLMKIWKPIWKPFFTFWRNSVGTQFSRTKSFGKSAWDLFGDPRKKILEKVWMLQRKAKQKFWQLKVLFSSSQTIIIEWSKACKHLIYQYTKCPPVKINKTVLNTQTTLSSPR